MSYPSTLPPRLVVAGIGTDVGKTVVSGILCAGLGYHYWKPVQSGRSPSTDSEWLARHAGIPSSRILPEAYLLDLPASPHLSAAAEGIRIEPSRLTPPTQPDRLLIELAGGLMVPLNEDTLAIDMLTQWQYPVVLVVRTYLGAINHSLLSIEALRHRDIPIAGLVMNAGEAQAAEDTIQKLAAAPVLGRLPADLELTPSALLEAFHRYFVWGGATLT